MARSPIKFERKEDDEKLNPNSLRRIFIEIINQKFDGNKTIAAKELTKFVTRYNKQNISKNLNSITCKKILLIQIRGQDLL